MSTTKSSPSIETSNVTPSDHSSDQRQQSVRFLALPAELRNHIYVYALRGHPFRCRTTPLQAGPNPDNDYISIKYPCEINFKLLLCCKQIHEEAHKLPYKLNTFCLELHDDHEIFDILNSCPLLTSIRHLALFGCIEDQLSMSTMLDWLLTQFHLQIHDVDMCLIGPAVSMAADLKQAESPGEGFDRGSCRLGVRQ
jgi:hypothetical protein